MLQYRLRKGEAIEITNILLQLKKYYKFAKQDCIETWVGTHK